MTDLINDLVAGDSIDFTTTVDGYPASAGWSLSYALRGPSVINLTAAASGDDFHVQATAATTATWIPGRYNWVATCSLSGQRYTVASGVLTIEPDLVQQVAGYDGRSQAKQALDDAHAALAGFRASRGRIKKYTIGTRTMEFESIADILAEISYWKLRVANEDTASSLAAGLGNPRRLQVRFR